MSIKPLELIWKDDFEKNIFTLIEINQVEPINGDITNAYFVKLYPTTSKEKGWNKSKWCVELNINYLIDKMFPVFFKEFDHKKTLMITKLSDNILEAKEEVEKQILFSFQFINNIIFIKDRPQKIQDLFKDEDDKSEN